MRRQGDVPNTTHVSAIAHNGRAVPSLGRWGGLVAPEIGRYHIKGIHDMRRAKALVVALGFVVSVVASVAC